MLVFTLLLDGLAYGMVLFIISVGLTITLGLMRVVNLGHGAFAMTGGYLAATMIQAGVPFFVAALAAAAGTALLGALAERTIYRPLYRKGELPQALMTFGLCFVAIAVLTMIYGSDIQPLPVPKFLAGLVNLGYRTYPAYRLFLIVVGAVLAVFLWVLIEGSHFGARLRAAVDNPRMARAVGINVNRLFTVTFAGGCALAGFGGVIGAEMLPLEPFYALRYLVLFLVVVGVGGHGNFKGSLVAALIIGGIDSTGKFLFPGASAYLLYGIVLVLLLWRPHGILPPKSAG